MSEVVSDVQKKFQRVDFDVSNVRNEIKELTDKNSQFKSDIMSAIREIKEICRTNSTSINKISDEINILKDDMHLRVETVVKSNEELSRQIHDNYMDLSNFKSNSDREMFDIKSESGFLNKSVKKLM